MKLAYLASRESIHTVRWVNAMVDMGHEVHLLATRNKGGDPLKSEVYIHKLPFGAPHGYFLNVPFVNKLLDKIKPDVVHAHRASGDGTLGRFSLFHPMVLSVWGDDVYLFPEKSRLHHNLVVKNIQSADVVCSTSHVMANRVRNICPCIGKINITPFGIDTERFFPDRKYKDSSVITIGTVKTLAPKYGIDILIRAFAKARQTLNNNNVSPPSLQLQIVGDGPKKKALQQLAQGLGIGEVTHFEGTVPHSEVPVYLNKFDVYVAASRFDSESFGVAVLEASACGVPVIVSNSGGLPEVVLENKTGFVVENENIEILATKMIQLVTNENLRHKLGTNGCEHVKKNYSWSQSVLKMNSIYQKILNS